MADLINLYEIAQASGHQSIYVATDRCVPVQHRRSSCRRCVEVCPVDAIEYEGRKLTLTNALCIGCGACATVCPTEALIPLDPTEAALGHRASSALKHNDGVACIACARIAAREGVSGDCFAEVPCLSRVNESLLLSLVAEGASEVLLVDGGCHNCKYRDCDPVTKSVVDGANDMLATQNCAVRIKRVGTFPDTFSKKPEEQLGVARRAAFEEAGMSTKGLLGRAAKMFVKQEAGQNKATSMIVEAMGFDLSDPEPLAPRRQENALDALFAIGEANGCAYLLPDDEAFGAPEGEDGQGALGSEDAPATPEGERAGTPGDAVAQTASEDEDTPATPEDEGVKTGAISGDEGAQAASESEDEGGQENVVSDGVDAEASEDVEAQAASESEGAQAASESEGEETPRFDGPTIDCRFFGWMELDSLRCNRCGICAVVCKQGALARCEEKMANGEKPFLAFTPSACVQCNLCAEACFRKAITITSEVPLSELFSFDPVLLRA